VTRSTEHFETGTLTNGAETPSTVVTTVGYDLKKERFQRRDLQGFGCAT
jgi:hypothetical protein